MNWMESSKGSEDRYGCRPQLHRTDSRVWPSRRREHHLAPDVQGPDRPAVVGCEHDTGNVSTSQDKAIAGNRFSNEAITDRPEIRGHHPQSGNTRKAEG